MFIISNRHFFQINRGSKYWYPLTIGSTYGNGELHIETFLPCTLHVLNEEDIPHILMTALRFEMSNPYHEQQILLSLRDTENDAGIYDMDPSTRQCLFPHEQFDTKYKAYSYTVCITECIKKIQLIKCNCVHHNYRYNGKSINRALRQIKL